MLWFISNILCWLRNVISDSGVTECQDGSLRKEWSTCASIRHVRISLVTLPAFATVSHKLAIVVSNCCVDTWAVSVDTCEGAHVLLSNLAMLELDHPTNDGLLFKNDERFIAISRCEGAVFWLDFQLAFLQRYISHCVRVIEKESGRIGCGIACQSKWVVPITALLQSKWKQDVNTPAFSNTAVCSRSSSRCQRFICWYDLKVVSSTIRKKINVPFFRSL